MSTATQLHAYGTFRSRFIFGGKFVALFTIFAILAWKRLDPDFGWHLQAGKYILQHGIPAHDVFTYTARSFSWINHEWGNDVLVALLYNLGGYDLIAVVFGFIWSLAILLAAREARAVSLLLATACIITYAGIRPVAWTVLLLVILLWFLRPARSRFLWVLPGLFALWANLHGGFVFGLFILSYIAIYERRWRLLGLSVACTGATLLNPYGPRLYVEIVRTLTDTSLHNNITEWARFSITPSSAIFIILWVTGSVLYDRTPLIRWFRPATVLLTAALSAARNFPLYIVGSLSETDRYIARLLHFAAGKFNSWQRWIFGSVLLFLPALVIVQSFYLAYAPLWGPQDREIWYPEKAVSYIQHNGCGGGQLFNDYDYGGYLIWKLSNVPVYIDGRMPSWRNEQGEKYMDLYNFILDHPSAYQTTFNKYDITCAVLEMPKDNGLATALRQSHWQVKVQTTNYILLFKPH